MYTKGQFGTLSSTITPNILRTQSETHNSNDKLPKGNMFSTTFYNSKSHQEL